MNALAKTSVGILGCWAGASLGEAATIPAWVDYSGDNIIWAEFGEDIQSPVTARTNLSAPLSGNGEASTTGVSTGGNVSESFSITMPNLYSAEHTKHVTVKFDIRGLMLAPNSFVPIPLGEIAASGHGNYPEGSGLNQSLATDISISPDAGEARNWVEVTVKMTFDPQPASENIFIFLPDVAGTPTLPEVDATIRRLRVSSQCTPEPPSLLLLAAGLLAWPRRR